MGIVRTIFSVVLLGGLVAMLWWFVRFAIISAMRTKGAESRLRAPQPDGIEQISGFPAPPELVRFYMQAPFVQSKEFYLVDHSRTPAAIWPIGSFNPLTPRDVLEQKKISGVKNGIPIADDLDKGMYYIDRNGAVRLRSPNVPSNDVEVAKDVTALLGFELHREWPGATR